MISPDEEPMLCRICFQGHGVLLRVCNCAGTMAYVHNDCLQDWINSRRGATDLRFVCELCDTPYNLTIQKPGLMQYLRECGPAVLLMSIFYVLILSVFGYVIWIQIMEIDYTLGLCDTLQGNLSALEQAKGDETSKGDGRTMYYLFVVDDKGRVRLVAERERNQFNEQLGFIDSWNFHPPHHYPPRAQGDRDEGKNNNNSTDPLIHNDDHHNLTLSSRTLAANASYGGIIRNNSSGITINETKIFFADENGQIINGTGLMMDVNGTTSSGQANGGGGRSSTAAMSWAERRRKYAERHEKMLMMKRCHSWSSYLVWTVIYNLPLLAIAAFLIWLCISGAKTGYEDWAAHNARIQINPIGNEF